MNERRRAPKIVVVHGDARSGPRHRSGLRHRLRQVRNGDRSLLRRPTVPYGVCVCVCQSAAPRALPRTVGRVYARSYSLLSRPETKVRAAQSVVHRDTRRECRIRRTARLHPLMKNPHRMPLRSSAVRLL